MSVDIVAVLTGHQDRVWCVAWNTNGSLLASASGDKCVRLWGQASSSESDHSNGNSNNSSNSSGAVWVAKGALSDAHQRTIRAVAFSPDSRLLATASFDATIGIWQRSEHTGLFECITNLEGHENEVKSVAWSPTGTLLASCSRDKSVWIWNLDADMEFECGSVLQDHTQDVKMVAWHPHEEILASCSYDDTIRIWKEDMDDWYLSETLEGHTSTVWCVSFSPDGARLASVSDDRSLKIWRRLCVDEASEKYRWQCVTTVPDCHSRTIYSCAWSRSNRIATCGADDSIRIFEVSEDSDQVRPTLTIAKAHSADVNSVAWNPADPDLLASGSDDGTIKLWRYRTQ